MKITVYLLVGFLGSGKSTWARKKAEAQSNLVIVNRDSLRTMFNGSYGFSQSLEPLVKAGALKLLGEAISQGFDVIIDETNLTRRARAVWIKEVTELANRAQLPLQLEVVHFTETESNVAYRAQDDLRGYSVKKWRDVLISMKQSYEPPEIDEFPVGTWHSTQVI